MMSTNASQATVIAACTRTMTFLSLFAGNLTVGTRVFLWASALSEKYEALENFALASDYASTDNRAAAVLRSLKGALLHDTLRPLQREVLSALTPAARDSRRGTCSMLSFVHKMTRVEAVLSLYYDCFQPHVRQ